MILSYFLVTDEKYGCVQIISVKRTRESLVFLMVNKRENYAFFFVNKTLSKVS